MSNLFEHCRTRVSSTKSKNTNKRRAKQHNSFAFCRTEYLRRSQSTNKPRARRILRLSKRSLRERSRRYAKAVVILRRYQTIGSFPWLRRYSLACEKCRQPKNRGRPKAERGGRLSVCSCSAGWRSRFALGVTAPEHVDDPRFALGDGTDDGIGEGFPPASGVRSGLMGPHGQYPN